MALDEVAARGLVLLGCGKMGSALLRGWLDRGLSPGAVHVIEPRPSEWLQGTGVALNGPLPEAPAVALVAVKPQMMGEALPAMVALGGGRTLVVSIAAGTPLKAFEAAFGAGTPVVSAMPNTPAAIGQGITALVANAAVSREQRALCGELLAAVGSVAWLDEERHMDAVTAISGSGPAYVFLMIECLEQAAVELGLDAALAKQLAVATVAGAGAYAASSGEAAAELRRRVTSPKGTTQAALDVLMAHPGLRELLVRATRAAAERSRELAKA